MDSTVAWIVGSIAGITIGTVFGCLIGYLLGKNRAMRSVDVSAQMGTISSLTTQIAEMKGKFAEMERGRERVEKERERYEAERERRLGEFTGGMHKLFDELSSKTIKSDEEKEKRIKEMTEQTQRFFNEQRASTEKFLTEQGKSREEIEKRRDAQIADMKGTITIFTKAVSGTSTRGQVGEAILRQALGNSIQAGVVKPLLHTEEGDVEFAWCLGDGKHIPIDSKLPDVMAKLEELERATDPDAQKAIRKELAEKVRKEFKTIQKYQNLANTIDSCILVAPKAVIEAAPELVGEGRDMNVFVCSYTEVFPVAHLIQDRYIQMKGEGEIGRYKGIAKALLGILDKIEKRTDAIERATTAIVNANRAIKDEVVRGKRQDSSASQPEGLEDFASADDEPPAQ